jgi:hypothetical protein
MEEMISFCGIGCHECDAFEATKNDNDKKRILIAMAANLKAVGYLNTARLAESGSVP